MATSFPDTQVPQLSPAQRSLVRRILFFDAMLTPKIITIVYWLMLVACALAGLVAMSPCRSSASWSAWRSSPAGRSVRASGASC